tara:strand:+ start:1563 stop:1919 length:357 start_codon:yes stop_codon:yes gene_type:complete
MIFVFWPTTIILSFVTSYFVNIFSQIGLGFFEELLFFLDIIVPYLLAAIGVEKLREGTFKNPFFLYPMLLLSFLFLYRALIINPNLYTFSNYLDLFSYTLTIIYMGFYRKRVPTEETH